MLGMSVRRAAAEIGPTEFAHWIALENIDPAGTDRDDFRTGLIAKTVVDAAPSFANGPQPQTKIADFMLDPWGDAKAKANTAKADTSEQIKHKMSLLLGPPRPAKREDR